MIFSLPTIVWQLIHYVDELIANESLDFSDIFWSMKGKDDFLFFWSFK